MEEEHKPPRAEYPCSVQFKEPSVYGTFLRACQILLFIERIQKAAAPDSAIRKRTCSWTLFGDGSGYLRVPAAFCIQPKTRKDIEDAVGSVRWEEELQDSGGAYYELHVCGMNTKPTQAEKDLK